MSGVLDQETRIAALESRVEQLSAELRALRMQRLRLVAANEGIVSSPPRGRRPDAKQEVDSRLNRETIVSLDRERWSIDPE